MAEHRRLVRPTTDFFQDLDRQLPAERGPDGRPSRADFQAYELFSIIDRFATGFDDLPELISGRPQYRLLIAAGTIVSAVSVVGQLASDGSIELVGLKIDTRPIWSTGDSGPGE